MKVTIELPEALEEDFRNNQLSDFFGRVAADIKGNIGDGNLCGRYELETAEILSKAFENAITE